jgi:hypothetical protein
MPKQKEAKKTRAKCLIILDPLVGLQKGDELSYINTQGERIICPWEVKMVTPQLTDPERQKARQGYRKEYMKKPKTIAKVKARMADPEVIAKRKVYAEREDVKKRKKELAARARAIRRALKETQPENYELLKLKVENALRQNAEWVESHVSDGTEAAEGSLSSD